MADIPIQVISEFRLAFFVWLCNSIAEDEVIFPQVDGNVSFILKHAKEEEFSELRSFIKSMKNAASYLTTAESYSEFCLHTDLAMLTIQKHFHDEEATVSLHIEVY